MLALRPERVGLPAYTEEIHDAASIARILKRESPATEIIVGGYHVSAIPEETLREFQCFDFGVIGEGERPLADLYRGAAPRTITGLVVRCDDGRPIRCVPDRPCLDLDSLPVPD